MNSIYHGDNLYYLPDIPSGSIDLIYIDPPFGTQTLWKSKAFREKVQELQFYDIFGGGIAGYINFMVERLRHMHRVLKPTGSLFVHLDWRASHYIKIELDKIFGVTNPTLKKTNFVNEIIWAYRTGGTSKEHFARKHDTILFYSKENSKKKFFPTKERNYTKSKSRKPGIHNYGQADCEFFEDDQGVYNLTYLRDVWNIPYINSQAKERTGYPTQKPLDLLKRIIRSTTQENDVVADFFCGCGTAIDAAQALNRKWLGVDASKTACEATQGRMVKSHSVLVDIEQKPMTKSCFEQLTPFEFERAAVRYIGGIPNTVQVGDGGVDGRLAYDGTPIQVKKHTKKVGDVDSFRSFYEKVKQHGRGIFIALNGFSFRAKQRANVWRREGLDIQLLTVQDILDGKFREQPNIPLSKAS